MRRIALTGRGVDTVKFLVAAVAAGDVWAGGFAGTGISGDLRVHQLGDTELVALRDWIEWYPEKILFGTDLYPGSGADDWEEIGWQTSQTARQALGIALTGMLEDGEITLPRANEIARMILRENALKLYHLTEHP